MSSTQHNRRFVVTSDDVGKSGFVSGAALLDWIDRVAYTVAAQWSHRPHVVAASVGAVHLDRPIAAGELVDLEARLVYTGKSSMHILITVCSFDPVKGAQSAQCAIVFVAVEPGAGPVAVPAWTPSTMLELQRHRQARMRIRMRRRFEQELLAHNCAGEGTASGVTRQFHVAGADGCVEAGRVLRWLDDTACACAADWIGEQAITAYIAGIRLCGPVLAGDVVEVSACVMHTGPRSVHIGFDATATRPGGERVGVAHGASVAVSLDKGAGARPVPQWIPDSDADRRLDRCARALIDLRQYAEPFTTAVVPTRQ
jgi:4-hydroxybenzoyl-CoA thioesterase